MTFKEVLRREMQKHEEPMVQATSVENPLHPSTSELLFDLDLSRQFFRPQKIPYNSTPQKRKAGVETRNRRPSADRLVLLSELAPAEIAALHLLQKHLTEWQVSEVLSLSQLKKAYRKLAKKYHPDVCPTQDASIFQSIQEAHRTLLQRLKSAPATATSEPKAA